MGEPAIDYGLLDRLGVGRASFYPRRDEMPPPAGARDVPVEVAPGVAVVCRFFPGNLAWPTVLFFHGNGEVAQDYDEVAPLYHKAEANLWVADYRGYGASDGTPTFAALVADAHPVLDAFHALLDREGFNPARFVMGRSLGGHPALELAARRPQRLRGLIVESGATTLNRLANHFGNRALSDEAAVVVEEHRAKLASITLPALVIHGEQDELIPVERALAFYRDLNGPKELCLIPNAGHNDLSWVGVTQYFAAIAAFLPRFA